MANQEKLDKTADTWSLKRDGKSSVVQRVLAFVAD